MSDAQANELLNLTTTLGAGAVLIERIEGQEEISELFAFRLEFVAPESGVDYASLIGTNATVKVQSNDAPRRFFSGIITRVRLIKVNAITGATTFEADLRPEIWKLGLQADCKIFMEKNVPDIIAAVLSGAGLAAYENQLQKTYAVREYCVQYRETALDFILRLMEEEGIFYFFRHTTSGHKLVLADATSVHEDCPGTSTLRYRENITENLTEEDVVSQVVVQEQMVTTGVAVNNYNFETPATRLLSTAGQTTRQVHDFPARHMTTTVGEAIAKRRLEALELDAKQISGTGTLSTLIAGYKITMTDYLEEAVNASYVVRIARISASRLKYECSFVAYPSTKPFAPIMKTPRPIIPSTQTAVVVGKSGEEQWVDKYGRIKVQFHWDRLGQKNEESSCWVRVAHSMASKGWGMVYIPRIGQEVVVSFLEGDPDRPLVTGAVYNADAMPPYTLPDEQTKSTFKSQSTKSGTGKFNEIRFDDKIDAEQIYMHAQKDMLTEVLNDYKRDIKHDQTVIVKNDSKLNIDHDQTITIKNNLTETVSEGNASLTITKGTRDISVKGAETHLNDADFTHKVGGAYTLKVKGDLSITVDGALTIKAASIDMQSTSGEIGIKASTGLNAKAGTAGKFEAGTSLNLKASTTLQADGLSITIKASASGTYDGGGMMAVKGGMVKIN